MQAEQGAFSFPRDGGGEEVRGVPFVYVPNIIKKVSDTLSLNRRYGSVCFVLLHAGAAYNIMLIGVLLA